MERTRAEIERRMKAIDVKQDALRKEYADLLNERRRLEDADHRQGIRAMPPGSTVWTQGNYRSADPPYGTAGRLTSTVGTKYAGVDFGPGYRFKTYRWPYTGLTATEPDQSLVQVNRDLAGLTSELSGVFS